MTKKTRSTENRRAQKEHEIQRQWYMRPDAERTSSHIEDFADDIRQQGLGLMRDPTLNVQAVRGLLRMF